MKRLCLSLLLSLMFSLSLGAATAEFPEGLERCKFWIYVDIDQIPREAFREIEYPQRTKQRLAKMGIDRHGVSADRVLDLDWARSVLPAGVEPYLYVRSLCALGAFVTREARASLVRVLFVRRVERVGALKLPEPVALEINAEPRRALAKNPVYGASYSQLEQLNIPAVHAAGLTGKGVRIAIFDTGFFKQHRVFDRIFDEDRLVAERDFIYNDSEVSDETSQDTTSEGYQQSHGGEVWSIIGGYQPNEYIGAAYNAEFVLAKTEILGSETRLEEDLFIAAVDWADSIGVDVMTTSLGYRDFDDYVRPFGDLDGRTAPVSKAVNWAFERGIVFTVSASNEGNNPHFPDGGLSSPADAPGALTVGAVDSEGRLAGFSSHGPTADGRTKPDLVARGLSTDMAIDIGENRYGRRSGTSFAAPLIAGAAALILEKYPHWCPADVMQALKQFASLRENPDPYYGWGLPDVYRSIFESVDPGYPEIEMSGRTVLVFPNPVNGRAQFAIRWPLLSGIPRDGARLEVYNILGRLVFEESLAVDMPGQQFLVPWDLRDPAGRVVPSGVYIAIVDGKTPIAAGLLTVVH